MVAPGNPKPVIERQVAPDIYFVFDFDSSNAAVVVTDDGVLVTDTRQHPLQQETPAILGALAA